MNRCLCSTTGGPLLVVLFMSIEVSLCCLNRGKNGDLALKAKREELQRKLQEFLGRIFKYDGYSIDIFYPLFVSQSLHRL